MKVEMKVEMGAPAGFTIDQLRALINIMEQTPNLTRNEHKYTQALRDELRNKL
jgi:hypothetical protein